MKGIKSRTTPSSAFAFFLPLCLYSLEGPLLLLQIHLLELYLPLTRLEPQPNVPWFQAAYYLLREHIHRQLLRKCAHKRRKWRRPRGNRGRVWLVQGNVYDLPVNQRKGNVSQIVKKDHKGKKPTFHHSSGLCSLLIGKRPCKYSSSSEVDDFVGRSLDPPKTSNESTSAGSSTSGGVGVGSRASVSCITSEKADSITSLDDELYSG